MRYIRVDEDEIDDRCAALRKELEKARSGSKSNGSSVAKTKSLKTHQVHELAQAKIVESEKLRKALGIRQDYEEGGHRKRKEEREREREKERIA